MNQHEDHGQSHAPSDGSPKADERLGSTPDRTHDKMPDSMSEKAPKKAMDKPLGRGKRRSDPREVRILRRVTFGMIAVIILLTGILLSQTTQKTLLPSFYDPLEDTGRSAKQSDSGDASDPARFADTLSAGGHHAAETLAQPETRPEEPHGDNEEPTQSPDESLASETYPDEETGVITLSESAEETDREATDPDRQDETETTQDAETAETAETGEVAEESSPAAEETADPETTPASDPPGSEEPSDFGGVWYGAALHSRGLLFESTGNGECTVIGIGSCTDAHLIIPEYSPDGERVVAIAPRAFLDCRFLTAVTIPACVETIGQLAFASCTNLAYIFVDPDNPSYVSLDGTLYSRDLSVLFLRPPARNSDMIIIPRSVEVIDIMAFYGSRSLSLVLYEGTPEDWQKICIHYGNNNLLAATLVYD